MSKIKNSTCLSDELRTFCNVKKMQYCKPMLDIETRWNSTYYMLKRFRQLEPALASLAADDSGIENIYPDASDLTAIKVR